MQMKLVNSGVSASQVQVKRLDTHASCNPPRVNQTLFKIQWCNASCRNDNLMQALTQDMDSCAEVLRGHRTTLESATAEDEAPWNFGAYC